MPKTKIQAIKEFFGEVENQEMLKFKKGDSEGFDQVGEGCLKFYETGDAKYLTY